MNLSGQKLVRHFLVHLHVSIFEARPSSFLQVPFLNLMANLQQRSGGVVIRIGGNTQEFAAQVPLGSLPDGRTFSKEDSGINSTVRLVLRSILCANHK